MDSDPYAEVPWVKVMMWINLNYSVLHLQLYVVI